MKCNSCGQIHNKVIESRDLDEGSSIRRRRQCLTCGSRFTTYERIEQPYLSVVKKNGDRELFSKQKLSGGIYKSLEKRPVSAARIELLISSIERELYNLGEAEVKSSVIGELVMGNLIKVDDVAYVRFASVYRSFTNLGSFQKEIDKLKDTRH